MLADAALRSRARTRELPMLQVGGRMMTLLAPCDRGRAAFAGTMRAGLAPAGQPVAPRGIT